ncbi:acetylxylan esterase [Tessaracoccus antarcticus]|uniref:Acetylxylan esterase n=1 Tax=Tessaracoccus antarcticus TaxID=2479848 RepID=A0A3M0G9Q7_9ACTN|nr:acetylxylan esterase [Tessaracoccus antarcticus]RMB61188.1 acetylxylan esterase [Tessaracoccus antarcticus]
MAQYDLPLSQLREFRPNVQESPDFDGFWARTLAADPAVSATEEPLENRLSTIDTYDITFTGFGGAPIKAWLHVPAGTNTPLPGVVRYGGYSGSRGMPFNAKYAAAGYAEFVMDSRGQGWWGSNLFGGTADHHTDAGAFGPPGPMTKGIGSAETYYYRRLITDAARLMQYAAGHRLVDPSRLFVAGGSQGGYLTIAAAGLAPSLRIELAGAMPDVAFMCTIRRGVEITDNQPFSLVADLLKAAPHMEDQVWETLSHFDGVSFAGRATCPGYFSVALADPTCPPSTVFPAYNAWQGDKDIEIYPYNGHEGGGDVQTWKQLGWLADR